MCRNLILILSILILYNSHSQNELVVGQKAPEIIFDKSFPYAYEIPKGKIIVLDFWTTWCPPCIQSLIEHNDLIEKYSKDIEFIAITNNSSRNVEEFVKSRDFKYNFIIDKEDLTFNNFGVTAVPYLFIIDTNNTIVWSGHSRQLEENDLRTFLKLYNLKKEKINVLKKVPKTLVNDKKVDTVEISRKQEKDVKDLKRLFGHSRGTAEKKAYSKEEIIGKETFILKIVDKDRLDKHKTSIMSKKENGAKGIGISDPGFNNGNFSGININLDLLAEQISEEYKDKIIVFEDKEGCSIKIRGQGYDFIQVPFTDFKKLKSTLLNDYGISIEESKRPSYIIKKSKKSLKY